LSIDTFKIALSKARPYKAAALLTDLGLSPEEGVFFPTSGGYIYCSHIKSFADWAKRNRKNGTGLDFMFLYDFAFIA
jgi:hypothetical protein